MRIGREAASTCSRKPAGRAFQNNQPDVAASSPPRNRFGRLQPRRLSAAPAAAETRSEQTVTESEYVG